MNIWSNFDCLCAVCHALCVQICFDSPRSNRDAGGNVSHQRRGWVWRARWLSGAFFHSFQI